MAYIQKREDDHGKITYIVRYLDPTEKERSKSFKLLREAKAFKTEVEGQLQTGSWTAPDHKKVKLYDVVNGLVEQAHTEGTRNVRKFTRDNLGAFGNTKIGDIQPSHVRTWVNQLLNGRDWADGKTVERSSANTCLVVVKAALNQCVNDGALIKSPANNIKIPHAENAPVTRDMLLTPVELKLLRKHAAPTPAVMILLAASTGLRPSELGGLRVRSVDLVRKQIHVTEQVGRSGSEWNWHRLKTGTKAVRTLPVPQQAMDALTIHLEDREATSPNDPLFLTRKKGQWTATTFHEAFTTAAARAGISEHFSPKDLRHFYASALIESGVSVRTVQERLGHATPNQTLRTYTHLWPDNDSSTRDAIDQVLA